MLTSSWSIASTSGAVSLRTTFIPNYGFMLDAAERPESFSIREGDIRRVNLHRFPYHFLFRIVGDEVRILVFGRRRVLRVMARICHSGFLRIENPRSVFGRNLSDGLFWATLGAVNA
jgi:hypothetical protein